MEGKKDVEMERKLESMNKERKETAGELKRGREGKMEMWDNRKERTWEEGGMDERK